MKSWMDKRNDSFDPRMRFLFETLPAFIVFLTAFWLRDVYMTEANPGLVLIGAFLFLYLYHKTAPHLIMISIGNERFVNYASQMNGRVLLISLCIVISCAITYRVHRSFSGTTPESSASDGMFNILFVTMGILAIAYVFFQLLRKPPDASTTNTVNNVENIDES
jgi:hypothetical protein